MNSRILLGSALAIALAVPFAWAILVAPSAVAIVLGGAVALLLAGSAVAARSGVIRWAPLVRADDEVVDAPR